MLLLCTNAINTFAGRAADRTGCRTQSGEKGPGGSDGEKEARGADEARWHPIQGTYSSCFHTEVKHHWDELRRHQSHLALCYRGGRTCASSASFGVVAVVGSNLDPTEMTYSGDSGVTADGEVGMSSDDHDPIVDSNSQERYRERDELTIPVELRDGGMTK